MPNAYWDTSRAELVLPSGGTADNEYAVLAALAAFAHDGQTIPDRDGHEGIVLVSERAAVAALMRLFREKSLVSTEELFSVLVSDLPFEEIRTWEILVPRGGFALVRTNHGDSATVEIYRRGPYYI